MDNNTWICSNCGNAMKEGIFCFKCGTPKIAGLEPFSLKDKGVLLYPDGHVSNIEGKECGTYKKDENNNTYFYFQNGEQQVYNSNNDLIKSVGIKGDTTTYFSNGYYQTQLSNGDIIKYDSNGKPYLRIYSSGEYEFNGKKYNLTNGVYAANDGKETISIDQNNNISIRYLDGTIKHYNECGILIQTESSNGEIIDHTNNSIIKKNNGKTVTSMVNHIEYDEEKYNHIMKTFSSIGSTYSGTFDNSCTNIESSIQQFPDSYSGSNISTIKQNIGSHLGLINSLLEMTNYSLLAYQGCDDALKNNLNDLIDSLFDEKQSGEMFKESLKFTIEDRDKDGILEYKLDTDFINVSENLIPTQKYIDKDNNVLYFNKMGELISADGQNIKIEYGGEMFNLSFGENGCVKLKDSHGNPINIFGDYNIPSGQYGGDQSAFIYGAKELLNNNRINKILNNYFPQATMEEKYDLFHRLCNMGCGYTAMANVAFKMMEGKEEAFKENFGYPMYNVTLKNNTLSVDYNYEPLILELYSEKWGKYSSISIATEKGVRGSTPESRDFLYDYLCDKYDISNYSQSEVHYVSDAGYSLYRMNGDIYTNDGGSHAMIITEETSDGEKYVSTWGGKYKYVASNSIDRVFNSNKEE